MNNETNNQIEERASTIFGAMAVKHAEWLIRKNVFNYKTKSIITQKIIPIPKNYNKKDGGGYQTPKQITAVVNYDAIMKGINEPRFYAEICKMLNVKNPSENIRVAYMIESNLFEKMLHSYKCEREEAGTTFLD